jgi:putative tricarboxylic transport membrane protein
MAKRGRAGAALATAAIGSFVAGTLSTFLLMVLAGVMVGVATALGAAEYALLILIALMMTSNLTGGSRVKSTIALAFGLALGMVGLDPQANVPRATFGIQALTDGIEFVVVAMALFAIPEALDNLSGRVRDIHPQAPKHHGRAWLSRQDWRRSVGPWLRGSFLGFFVGLLPGIGTLGSFFSYPLEKRLSKHKEEFGHGAIEGVAGPEAANNAGVGGGLVPLFTLGLPASPTLALLLFVFTMYGLQPGPGLFQGDNSTIVWAIIASMYIGNVMLLILNLPLVGLFEKLLQIPHVMLFPGVLTFVVLGAYATSFNVFSMALVLVFGVIGDLMHRADIPLAPAVLGLVLGPLLESSLRRALQISEGSLATFVDNPVSLLLTIIVLAVIIIPPLVRLIPRPAPALVAIADPSLGVAHAIEPELVPLDVSATQHREHPDDSDAGDKSQPQA